MLHIFIDTVIERMAPFNLLGDSQEVETSRGIVTISSDLFTIFDIQVDERLDLRTEQSGDLDKIEPSERAPPSPILSLGTLGGRYFEWW